MVLLLASGCATRDWVRETLGKKEAEIDQRMTAEAERVTGLDGRVKGVETGLAETGPVARGARERADGAWTRAEDASTRAVGAQGRADTAFARADEVDGRLTRLWSTRTKRDLVEAVQVHFGFNRWDLNDTAQTALVALVRELRENPRLSVDLEGYADPRGTYEYNVALSQRRVEAVRRHLVEQGIELPRIHSVGLGPIADKGVPDEKKRRVTVRLMVPAE
ncbi:MAG: hypothetical protein A2W08_18725 [Candidatus Rokubacteria bacterium RBG_16_73_20]|nr:MAG: hypothetical protein A2W08_18725 [Candidatus Rokubacteria bacterium RBG_16_73_20]